MYPYSAWLATEEIVPFEHHSMRETRSTTPALTLLTNFGEKHVKIRVFLLEGELLRHPRETYYPQIALLLKLRNHLN